MGSRQDYDAGNSRVTAVVVAKTGHMARMNAILPGEFIKRQREVGKSLIAEIVEELAGEYLVYLEEPQRTQRTPGILAVKTSFATAADFKMDDDELLSS